MDVREVYQRIQELQDEIAALGPLDPEVRKRIDYKFRLDWNYHSNNIEGGTLTVAETKSIMLGHVTVEDKPIRDVLEMRGHDQVVKTIFSIGKGEVQLSEKRIKEIHAAIIHEDDPTQKHLLGNWKQSPNEIINKGEKVAFTAPADVPEAMHHLLDWFKVEQDKIKRKDKDALPAPRLAFEFHLRFLTIHPFYDGNGRVGRILLNLILISLGYPPIIVTQVDKPKYNDLLTEIQLNGGSRNDLWVFLGKLLIRSLELVKRAIDGEEILEKGDVYKKIGLLTTDLKAETIAVGSAIHLGKESLSQHLISTFHPMVETVSSGIQKQFEELFFGFEIVSLFGEPEKKTNHKSKPFFRSATTFASDLINELPIEEKKTNSLIYRKLSVSIYIKLKSFKYRPLKPFDVQAKLELILDKTTYKINVRNTSRKELFSMRKILGHPLLPEEIEAIQEKLAEALFLEVEEHIKQE